MVKYEKKHRWPRRKPQQTLENACFGRSRGCPWLDLVRGEGKVFDLRDIGPSLGTARQPGDLASPARSIVEALLAADALIVATPVYKASYSGLFKHLFDLIDPTALAGKPVLLAATGGGDRHALVIEHHLRPLFGFFEAQTLATGVYASEGDFADGQPVSPPLLARLDRAVGQFAPFFPGHPAVMIAPPLAAAE